MRVLKGLSIAPEAVGGAAYYPGFLGPEEQATLWQEVQAVVEAAPPFRLMTRWGKPMSVEMTSAGRYGWFSDRRGYRYIDRHPEGGTWPPIPPTALRVWDAVAGSDRRPECCLVNRYGAGARMGLHQDRDEADFRYPVVSISLGDDALFRVGGSERGGPTQSVWLRSGDVVVLAGAARLAFHGVDRVRPGSGSLPGGGRINLTLRVVD